jgi:predicted nucleic acid-binding protein
LAEIDTAEFLRGLSRLGVTIDRSPEEAGVLALARKHGLSIYDASYLELAQRESIPLATLDKELRRAAGLERVLLLEPAASRLIEACD